jgi:hypothetical protein
MVAPCPPRQRRSSAGNSPICVNRFAQSPIITGSKPLAWVSRRTNVGRDLRRRSRNDSQIALLCSHLILHNAPLFANNSAFKNQIEEPDTAAIVRPGAHELIAPHVVRMLGPKPYARSTVEPQPSGWLLPLWDLQPFATPDALHAMLAHLPANSPEQHRDPAVPITTVLAVSWTIACVSASSCSRRIAL